VDTTCKNILVQIDFKQFNSHEISKVAAEQGVKQPANKEVRKFWVTPSNLKDLI
jgi:hypothetical protein